jgi:hypothetical protein
MARDSESVESSVPCEREGPDRGRDLDLGEEMDGLIGDQHGSRITCSLPLLLDGHARTVSVYCGFRISTTIVGEAYSCLSSELSDSLVQSKCAASWLCNSNSISRKPTKPKSSCSRMLQWDISRFIKFPFLFLTFAILVSAQPGYSGGPGKFLTAATSSGSLAQKRNSLKPRSTRHDNSLSEGAKIGIAFGAFTAAILVALAVLFCKFPWRKAKEQYKPAPVASRAWADEAESSGRDENSTAPSALENQDLHSVAPSSRAHTFIEHLFTHGSRRSGRQSRKQVLSTQPDLEVGVLGDGGPNRAVGRPATFMEHFFHRPSRRSERNWRKEVVPAPRVQTRPSDGQLNQQLSPVVVSPVSTNVQLPLPSHTQTQSREEPQELSTSRPASSHQFTLSRYRPWARHAPTEPSELPDSTQYNPLRRLSRRWSDRSRRRSRQNTTAVTVNDQELTTLQLPVRPLNPLDQLRNTRHPTRPSGTPGRNELEIVVELPSPPVSPAQAGPSRRSPEWRDDEFFVTPDSVEETERVEQEQERRDRSRERQRALRTEMEDAERCAQIRRRQEEQARNGLSFADAD